MCIKELRRRTATSSSEHGYLITSTYASQHRARDTVEKAWKGGVHIEGSANP